MRSGMIGNKGLMLAIMLACAMSAIEFFIGTPQRLEVNWEYVSHHRTYGL